MVEGFMQQINFNFKIEAVNDAVGKTECEKN